MFLFHGEGYANLGSTTEPLWAAAFLMRKLQDTKFEYPFQENQTPTQYGYKLIGEDRFATEHTYSIMHSQGRMPSFNLFMEGKFGSFGTMPDRLKRFGYDLGPALLSKESDIARRSGSARPRAWSRG